MDLHVEHLLAACGDESRSGGISVHVELEPLAGPGAPVKPAVYAGGVYQMDRRWDGEGEGRSPVDVIVIDNVPSQANRLEATLERAAGGLGLPHVVLDLSATRLPPHLPKALSGFRFPHRQADAYLRDSLLGGQAFGKTDVGIAVLSATAEDPGALFEWFPQALLFGFWQSHLGKKSQAKLARSWTSEIVGYEPATIDTRVLGLKGDPLNLSVEDQVVYDPDDQSSWVLGDAKKSAGSRKDRLSELGHGQVPVKAADAALGPVSFSRVHQQATVSFASLRRVWCGTPEANAAGRALLVALGLVAHVGAFGRAFSLRSGAELRPVRTSWTWLGEAADEPVAELDHDGASSLFGACVAAAEAAGLPVGSRWASEPLALVPSAELTRVIATTYPAEEGEG